ncbi:lipid II flippase MurJ [Polaromonas sp. UBA4122]|uniref:lipid II flippase MurJ n=1 Tax=Polaromonas sp. UBA4122 TaxID=1947074 RepID=UPI002600B19E|nr:lipid II flippase MurJ [Polaromonas sp. UBA4122]
MKRALGLMGLTGLNIIAVFAYQWYVLTTVGPGESTDALFAGMIIPQLILNVVSGSLAFVLVPMLSISEDYTFRQSISNFVSALTLIFGLMLAALLLTATWWVPLTVPGFSSGAKALTIVLARIQLAGMFFTGVGAVMIAGYQARHRFQYPVLTAVIASSLTLVWIVITLPRGGIVAAAWGLAIRPILQFLLQLPIVFPLMRPDWSTPQFKESLTKLRPLIFGTIYYKTDQLVDRLLVSMAPAGVLSLLHLAQQIYSAGYQVVVAALAIPVVPVLAKEAAEGDFVGFRARLLRTLKILSLIGTGTFVILLFPGRYGIDLMFGHGNFSGADIRQLWLIMVALGGFWISGLTGQILSTGFYALGDTSTPTRIGVIGFTIGIGLKISGFYLFGVIGVAIATGIYMTLNSLAMYVYLNRSLSARIGHVAELSFK